MMQRASSLAGAGDRLAREIKEIPAAANPSGRRTGPVWPNPHPLSNRIARVVWGIVWSLFYRPSPRPFHRWRRFLLRLFGAKLGVGTHPYPRVRIWAPWNLEMGDHSSLANDVDCYCVAPIRLGRYVTVSQYSFLCAASHDETDPRMPLTTAPISIGDRAWIAADVFIAPGVSIGEGAMICARSSVFKSIAAWTVAAGTPARPIRGRVLRTTAGETGEPLATDQGGEPWTR